MKLLTVNAAAETMSLSPQTVRYLLRTGALIGARYGAKWLVPVDSITAWTHENTYNPDEGGYRRA